MTDIDSCVAINKELSGDMGNVRRISSITGYNSNNVAWDGIAGNFTEKTLTGTDGEDRTLAQLKTQATYERYAVC